MSTFAPFAPGGVDTFSTSTGKYTKTQLRRVCIFFKLFFRGYSPSIRVVLHDRSVFNYVFVTDLRTVRVTRRPRRPRRAERRWPSRGGAGATTSVPSSCREISRRPRRCSCCRLRRRWLLRGLCRRLRRTWFPMTCRTERHKI